MSVQPAQDIERACTTLLRAFDNCPSNNYLNCKMQNVPLEIPLQSTEKAEQLTRNIIMHYINNGAEVVQANDYNTVAIWTTPEHPVPVARSADESFNKIFFDDLQKVKENTLPRGMKYYYLFIIGRDPDQPSNGAVRAIFDHYIALAKQTNNALVLEAISDHARDVYQHIGFKNYKTFKYGVNEVDTNGSINPNGNGHTGYLMIYIP